MCQVLNLYVKREECDERHLPLVSAPLGMRVPLGQCGIRRICRAWHEALHGDGHAALGWGRLVVLAWHSPLPAASLAWAIASLVWGAARGKLPTSSDPVASGGACEGSELGRVGALLGCRELDRTCSLARGDYL